MNLSIVIPTFNEEKNIKECLKSIGDFADEIVVVDMNSSDQTVEIAKKMGATVFSNQVDKNKIQAIQNNVNYGINKAKNSWIMRLDADERLTLEFKKEVELAIKNDILPARGRAGFPFRKTDDVFLPASSSPMEGRGIRRCENKKANAYLITRKQWFINGFLKGGDWAKSKIIRIFKKGSAYYDLKLHVHEKLVTSGKISEIKSPTLHYSHPDIITTIKRFNQYTDMEAVDKARENRNYLYDMITQPIYVFFRWMVAKSGWQDGTRGLVAALIWSFYQFLSYAKAWERKRN